MKLNGYTIPTPRQNIAVEYIEISRSERTVTGRLVKEKITIKKRFSIPYAGLKPEEALIFINAFEAGKPVLFEYEDVRGAQTATVYVTGVPREIYSPKPNYTANVTITLEER
jgi:hypothetical protein